MSAYTITETAMDSKHTPEEMEFVQARYIEASRALENEDYPKAEAAFRDGLSVVPEHAQSLAGLAMCVAEGHGRFLTAEKLARRAARLLPHLPDAHIALCRINRLGCRPKLARQHLKLAQRLAPRDSRVIAEVEAMCNDRGPVLSDLPAEHPLNQRLGQLRDVLMMRLRVSRKGVALEAAA